MDQSWVVVVELLSGRGSELVHVGGAHQILQRLLRCLLNCLEILQDVVRVRVDDSHADVEVIVMLAVSLGIGCNVQSSLSTSSRPSLTIHWRSRSASRTWSTWYWPGRCPQHKAAC